jgi:hypothetical protein
MGKCPKCNANVSIKLSNQVKCSVCNSNLVAELSPLGKAIILLIIVVESIASIVVAVIAGSINYPFLQKWVIAGTILLGLIAIALLLFFWTMNKMASLRLK